MSAAETQALVRRPCIVNNTTDATGVSGVLFRASLSGAPAQVTVTLPGAVKGMWLDLLARGCDVQYGVVLDGTAKPTLVYDTAVTAGTGATSGVAGATVLNGIKEPVWIPPNAKELVFIWAAATSGAYFEGNVSSQKVSL